jgi:hypothetical protein
MEGKDEMTKASGSLQDLRRGIYVKAKAEPSWRFWGLYVHVCKMETLQEAYAMAKKNNGAPGIDGVTFEAIEAQGAEQFMEQIRNELTAAGKEEGDTKGRGQGPRPVDPRHPRPRGAGGAQADTGADLRG